MDKIKEFTDLLAWQHGRELNILIYELTKRFPHAETYALTGQMRRSSSSITANIAEGFGRRGYKEKIMFYYLALGSLTELESHLILAKDIHYLIESDFNKAMKIADSTHRLLNGLIRKSKTLMQSS